MLNALLYPSFALNWQITSLTASGSSRFANWDRRVNAFLVVFIVHSLRLFFSISINTFRILGEIVVGYSKFGLVCWL